MAAPDFSTSYQRLTMSTGSGAQGADVSAPLSPLAPPFSQSWQHEHYETPYTQIHDSFFPIPLPDMSDLSYHNPNYARSPYPVHGGSPTPMHYPPSMYPYTSHQPRLPPAFRSGPVDALLDPSRSGAGDPSARNDRSTPRGAPPFFPPYHIGYQGLLHSATRYSPYSMPSQASTMPANESNEPHERNERNELFDGAQQSVRALSGGSTEQPRQFLPPHRRPLHSNQHQRPYQHQQTQTQTQTNRNLENRNLDDTERRPSSSLSAQDRRSDRSVSPRTSARRSFDRYSWDLPQSSTSSDIEEAAARAPPSNRVRHRPREGRPRFYSQHCDPNLSTHRQIQELKTTLPKFVASELPKETSPTCDICSKDYAATHVQPSEEEEIAVQLPCGHSFGEFCIFQWVC
jgi:hypothetical protein